jgi:hypothetical protein
MAATGFVRFRSTTAPVSSYSSGCPEKVEAVRAYGLGRGFVDYKICAIDETWSGLLFTRRR